MREQVSSNGNEGLVPASYIDMDVEDSVPASYTVDETETTITAVGDFGEYILPLACLAYLRAVLLLV